MITVSQIDHVHLYVTNLKAAARWYAHVLGLQPDPKFDAWAAQSSGPLFLKTGDGRNYVALFEEAPPVRQSNIVAVAPTPLDLANS